MEKIFTKHELDVRTKYPIGVEFPFKVIAHVTGIGIVAEYKVDYISELDIDNINNSIESGYTLEELHIYGLNRKLYGWHTQRNSFQMHDEPKPITYLKLERAPRSFMYIFEDMYSDVDG